RPHLLEQLVRGAAHLASARRGDDAVGARAVAADADLQPALERTLTPGGQVSREALELEISLRGERVARQELRKAMHLSRPERHVDEREALEHLLLHRLRPAPAHTHHAL